MLQVFTDRAINTRLIRELFRALLHRDPEPEALDYFLAQLADGYLLSDIAGQILSSPEFRLKLDDLPKSAPVPEIAVRPSVRPDTTGNLQIVIVTTDSLEKVANQVRLITAQMRPDDLVTVLSGSAALHADQTSSYQRVEVLHFPGESVFHLRMRLPSVAQNVRWIAVIEDHIIMNGDWLERVHTVIDNRDDDETAFVMSIGNLTSTSTWSWASFLLTFASVWHPIQDLRRAAQYGVNVVFPRSSLPASELAFLEFESGLLQKVCARAKAVNEIWVDHVQHCGFRRAASLHFHSGRVAGAHMRTNSPEVQVSVKKGLASMTRDRVRRCAELMATHPLKGELPRFTLLRVRLLVAVVALGYFVGACAGYGRSPWELE